MNLNLNLKPIIYLPAITLLIFTSLFCTPVHAAKLAVKGIADGHAEDSINAAIQQASAGDTIVIPAGTWTISSGIHLKSGVSIEGESETTTTIRGTYYTCSSDSDPGYLYGNGVSGFTISHLNFVSTSTGPSANGRTQNKQPIRLKNCKNIEIFSCKNDYWIYNDFLRAGGCDNIIMHDCWIASGHSAGYYTAGSKNCKAYNNDIEVHTNAGLRVDRCQNMEFFNNNIWCKGGGQAAFEIQNNCDGLKMYRNVVWDMARTYSGHWVVQNLGGTGKMEFYENVYWNSPAGVGRGVQSRDNKIDPSLRSLTYWNALGYGKGVFSGSSSSISTQDTYEEAGVDLTDKIYTIVEKDTTAKQIIVVEDVKNGGNSPLVKVNICQIEADIRREKALSSKTYIKQELVLGSV